MNDEIFLEASGITKCFVIGKHRIDVLKGVGLQVKRGEWVALLGASGNKGQGAGIPLCLFLTAQMQS